MLNVSLLLIYCQRINLLNQVTRSLKEQEFPFLMAHQFPDVKGCRETIPTMCNNNNALSDYGHFVFPELVGFLPSCAQYRGSHEIFNHLQTSRFGCNVVRTTQQESPIWKCRSCRADSRPMSAALNIKTHARLGSILQMQFRY
jgi:hypothetical protein